VAAVASAGQTQAQSLADAVQIAIASHPTVLAARAGYHAAEEGVKQQRAGLRPTVNARAVASRARSNNTSTRARSTRGSGDNSQGVVLTRTESNITLSQLIYDGQGTRSRVRAATERVDVATEQYFDAGEQIGFRAVQAYLDVLANHEIVALAEDNVREHETVVERVRRRAEAGGGSEADVNQAESRLALAQSTFEQFQGNRRRSNAAYFEVIGAEPADLFRPLPGSEYLPTSEQDAVDRAVASNPTLRAARANVRASSQELASSRSAFRPRLSFELVGTRNEDGGGVEGPNTDVAAQFVVTYNLYGGGGDTARKREAAIRIMEAGYREAETRRLVELATRSSFFGLETARDRLPQFQQRATAAVEVVSAYTQQFALGQRTLLDLLDVQVELFQSQADLVNGEFNVLISEYDVLARMGLLLDSLSVAVGMERPQLDDLYAEEMNDIEREPAMTPAMDEE
jgi:adhesin transport system outer membrane protein